MKAVILVGGKGTRLRPITYSVPKALMPLQNKPYIGHLVDALRASDLEGAVLSMGYLPDPIQAYFAEWELDGFKLQYAVEDHPLGTAGGIKNAEEHLEDGPFLATNGDVLTNIDFSKVIETHKKSGALATIALTAVENPTAYGLVEIDHLLRVQRFIEKPSPEQITTNLINTGVYVIEREVLEMIPEGREVSIEREIFPDLQAAGELGAYVSRAYWRDIGTPQSYLAASRDALSGAAVRGKEAVECLDLHPSARISGCADLLPPISIAEECEVESGATVGRYAALGKGCYVGEGAVVKESVLFEGVQVEEGAIIHNSIVGPGAVIRKNAVVSDVSVLGADYIVGEEEVVLNQKVRTIAEPLLARS